MSVLTQAPCALCGQRPTELIEPPRRTLDRGVDPDDNSFSITVILPDVALCRRHALYVSAGELGIGWCDDPLCRTYGEEGELSACGAQYGKLASNKKARSNPANQKFATPAKERK